MASPHVDVGIRGRKRAVNWNIARKRRMGSRRPNQFNSLDQLQQGPTVVVLEQRDLRQRIRSESGYSDCGWRFHSGNRLSALDNAGALVAQG